MPQPAPYPLSHEPEAQTCDGCGLYPRHGRAEHCIHCLHAQKVGDIAEAETALSVIEGTVRAALNGHANPGDILALVGRCISEMDWTPAEPLSDLMHEHRMLWTHRERAAVLGV